jgi:hypothetical protein
MGKRLWCTRFPALNPLGKGTVPVRLASGDALAPLPNIEDPKHPIGSPRNRPAPAGFGPYDFVGRNALPSLAPMTNDRSGNGSRALRRTWIGHPSMLQPKINGSLAILRAERRSNFSACI